MEFSPFKGISRWFPVLETRGIVHIQVQRSYYYFKEGPVSKSLCHLVGVDLLGREKTCPYVGDPISRARTLKTVTLKLS